MFLKGLIAAPFAPMFPDSTLNLDLIPRYCATLKSNGINGAFVNGSTGEGPSLTSVEKRKVLEAWTACAARDPDFQIINFLSSNSLNECLELAVHTQESGADAVAFTAPSYFKPSHVEILAECVAKIASSTSLPFYYYHIPVLTGAYFSMMDLLKAIHDRLPNFAGIKYTHEDFMDFAACLNFAGGRYNMLWGRDENLLPALALGTPGAVGSTYNYAAPLYHRLIHAFDHGDLELARAYQMKAIQMINLLGKYGGMGTGKGYMKLIGLDCGEFRLPVANLSAEQFNQFSRDALEIGFDQFKSRLTG